MDGIINLLKPPGITSHDAVSAIRRLTGIKRTGHTGTLDPGAAGVLPVCVGKATRVAEFVLEMDKVYRAELSLGRGTDTEDAAGTVIAEKDVPELEEGRVRSVLESFLGPGRQIPPMYSAVRVQGEKLYERARRGETVERAARPIHIYSIGLCGIEGNVILFDVSCSRGTYIRTLCREIAEKLDTTGHMSFLLRTGVGPFALNDAFSLEELSSLRDNNRLEHVFLPMETALLHLPGITVPPDAAVRVLNGMTVQGGESVPEGKRVRVHDDYGRLLSVAVTAGGYLKPEKVFK